MAIRMPWGKYRGKQLDEIPDDYLMWILDHADSASDTLKEAIRIQLKLQTPPPPPQSGSTATAEDMKPEFKRWYRTLAKEFHPDRRGGSDEAMVAINRAKELLFSMFNL